MRLSLKKSKGQKIRFFKQRISNNEPIGCQMKFYIGLRSFKFQSEHIETCHYPEFVQKQTTNSEEKHANKFARKRRRSR